MILLHGRKWRFVFFFSAVAVMYASALTGRVITFVFLCPRLLLSSVSIMVRMLWWPSSLFNKWNAFPPEWAKEKSRCFKMTERLRRRQRRWCRWKQLQVFCGQRNKRVTQVYPWCLMCRAKLNIFSCRRAGLALFLALCSVLHSKICRKTHWFSLKDAVFFPCWSRKHYTAFMHVIEL